MTTFSAWGEGDKVSASSIRWRDPKLVVATNKGVKIWQYVSSSLTLLGSWDHTENVTVPYVNFHVSYLTLLVLHYSNYSLSVQIKFFNGETFCSISPSNPIRYVASHENHVITANEDNILRIWDITTGACLKELEGHKDSIKAVDIYDGLIASADSQGTVIIWNTQAALEGGQAQSASFIHPDIRNNKNSVYLKLGQDVLVIFVESWGYKVMVVDFPASKYRQTCTSNCNSMF